jgi:RNase P protein component
MKQLYGAADGLQTLNNNCRFRLFFRKRRNAANGDLVSCNRNHSYHRILLVISKTPLKLKVLQFNVDLS